MEIDDDVDSVFDGPGQHVVVEAVEHAVEPGAVAGEKAFGCLALGRNRAVHNLVAGEGGVDADRVFVHQLEVGKVELAYAED